MTCEIRERGAACKQPARYLVQTLGDSFRVCDDHVSKYRIRPNCRVTPLVAR